PQYLSMLLLALPGKLLVAITPALMERGDSIAAAFGLARAGMPVFMQLEVRTLSRARRVELSLEPVEIAREIPLQHLMDADVSRSLGVAHALQNATRILAERIRQVDRERSHVGELLDFSRGAHVLLKTTVLLQ